MVANRLLTEMSMFQKPEHAEDADAGIAERAARRRREPAIDQRSVWGSSTAPLPMRFGRSGAREARATGSRHR